MVGGLAIALKKSGVGVSGSDAYQFPPMPEALRAAGISVRGSWAAAHVPRRVAAIVTGAGIARGNVEYEEALDRGVPVWNTTAFLEHYFLRDATRNVVVAGTKGKTTTTAMLAWILRHAGLDPDHLIGGQVRGDWERLRLRGADVTVLEGDEYWCAPGDPVPKFLRYHPRDLVITNVSYDHRDIFPTRTAYADAFRKVVDLVPGKGSLTVNADDPGALALLGRTATPALAVGFSRRADRRITRLRAGASKTEFRLHQTPFRLDLGGTMNVRNAALAAVAAGRMGVSLINAATALAAFPGVDGRQELLAVDGRTAVYQDDAYLPMAVQGLLEAIRQRHRSQRIVFFFVPRYTGGRDAWCQRELPDCMVEADVAVVASALEPVVPPKPFDHRRLCRELRQRGLDAHPVLNITKMARLAERLCRPGDVVVISLCLGADAYAREIAGAVVPQ